MTMSSRRHVTINRGERHVGKVKAHTEWLSLRLGMVSGTFLADAMSGCFVQRRQLHRVPLHDGGLRSVQRRLIVFLLQCPKAHTRGEHEECRAEPSVRMPSGSEGETLL